MSIVGILSIYPVYSIKYSFDMIRDIKSWLYNLISRDFMTKITLSVLFLLTQYIYGGNMFSLTGIKKIYPLVEISSKLVKPYKKSILSELNATLSNLQIDTSGYDQRAIALLINEQHVANSTIINIQLLIGEQVIRVDSKRETFAMTYRDKEYFVVEGNSFVEAKIEAKVEESIGRLFIKFTDQYRDDNVKIDRVKKSESDFATALKYETNYESALARGKKEGKNILFILVSNYCPWCRKFENRVLSKVDVDKAIHENYIPLIINREEGGFPKEFSKQMTPTVHFIDAKTQKVYHTVVGYNNREEFMFLISSDGEEDEL